MIPVFSARNTSPEIETALRSAWIAMNIAEKHLDTKGIPQPQDGVRFNDNIMEGVQYVHNEGRVEWLDVKPGPSIHDSPLQSSFDLNVAPVEHTTAARLVSDILGYESVSNCAAMWRECVSDGLLSSSVSDGTGWLSCTEYGIEQLYRWEGFDE